MAENHKRLKIALIGDDAVGKTSYLQRYVRQSFIPEYIPSTGAEMYSIEIPFNDRLVGFNIWDVPPGLSAEISLRDCDGVILMFDLLRPVTYEHIPQHYSNMLPCFGQEHRLPIPVVICGNKCDVINRVVKPRDITFHREKGHQYYDFSVRELYNFHKPLLFIARRVLQMPELDYEATPEVGEQLRRV